MENTIQYIVCKKCGETLNPAVNYCPNCGLSVPKPPKKKYSGTCIEDGIYEVTFRPVRGHFSTMDGAKEAAINSCWNEDEEMAEGFEIKRIHSNCNIKVFPYICGDCYDTVAKKDEIDGHCSFCDAINWIERDGTESEGEIHYNSKKGRS